jgi:hypothetical protein
MKPPANTLKAWSDLICRSNPESANSWFLAIDHTRETIASALWNVQTHPNVTTETDLNVCIQILQNAAKELAQRHADLVSSAAGRSNV